MGNKEQYRENKNRIFEIYGISQKERHKYSVHHIWFRSDGQHWWLRSLDDPSNLFPLKKEEHKRLHERIKNE